MDSKAKYVLLFISLAMLALFLAALAAPPTKCREGYVLLYEVCVQGYKP